MQHFAGKHCPETIRNLIIATEQVGAESKAGLRPAYENARRGEVRRPRTSVGPNLP